MEYVAGCAGVIIYLAYALVQVMQAAKATASFAIYDSDNHPQVSSKHPACTTPIFCNGQYFAKLFLHTASCCDYLCIPVCYGYLFYYDAVTVD